MTYNRDFTKMVQCVVIDVAIDMTGRCACQISLCVMSRIKLDLNKTDRKCVKRYELSKTNFGDCLE